MTKRKAKVSKVTILGEDDKDNPIVARFQTDSEGNVNIGVELDKLLESMNLDIIVAQPIIEKYESMFASLIFDKSTKDKWQHAFFDVYLFALALKAKKGGENGEADRN